MTNPVEQPLNPWIEPDAARQWASERARRLRAQLGTDLARLDVPSYGSPDWQSLPDNDPRRWLAALAAAEAWRHDSDPHVIAARVDVELEAQRQADERDHDLWRDIAGRVRRLASVPDHDQMQRRRAHVTRPAGYEPRPWPPVETP